MKNFWYLYSIEINDKRWVETIRLVREIMPSFALIENVYGIAEMALDQWCIDLERVGYTVQTFDISASCVGLPTVERHLWIVAASLEIGICIRNIYKHTKTKNYESVQNINRSL